VRHAVTVTPSGATCTFSSPSVVLREVAVEGLVLAALVLPDDDDREPENAERAAVRWLRKLLERPGVTLAELVRRSTPVSCSSRMPTAQRHRCGGSRVGSSARDRLALSAAGRPPRQR